MWFFVLALGCGDGEPTTTESRPIDDDGDGTVLGTDCDDTDASVHPGADERCNAVDDDCDGQVDDDAVDAVTVYADADADGYGDAADGTACVPGANQAAASGDCDDADPGAHPGAVEICNGGVDDDCDGAVDDADAAVGTTDWYADEDQDGYGTGTASSSCVAPKGLIADASDCDDIDAAVHPGAEETCNGIDDDCDPSTSETGMVWRAGILYWAIQDAIDDAFDGDPGDPGALVEICSGTFYENLVIDKSIELAGVSRDVSIIDGSERQGPVIEVVRPGVLLTVRGLTVQNGFTRLTEPGGIAAEQAAGLVVADSAIVHNSSWYGGGIAGPEHGPASILATIVSDNSGDQATGGGIVLYNDGTGDLTEIRDSEITNNSCGYMGGGVALFSSSEGRMAQAAITISDTLIDGNSCVVPALTWGTSGGGLSSSDVELTLSGVTVSNNEAMDYGGGIYASGNVIADDKTVVSGNTTAGIGGGVYVGAMWQYGTIEGNTAAYGGGIGLGTEGQARDVLIEANTATTAGGGVYMTRESEVHDSQILSNVSAGGGGGIYATYTSSSYEAVVDGCTIEGNVAATEGGGALIVNVGFQSISSDWGSGGTDNDPDDLVFYATTSTTDPVTFSDLETAEDFVCDTSDAVCE